MSEVGENIDIQSLWQSVMVRLKKERKAKIAALLDPARPVSLDGCVLTIAFGPESQFHKSQIEDMVNMRALEAVVKAVAGEEIRVRCVTRESGDGDDPCGGGGCGEADAPATSDAGLAADDAPGTDGVSRSAERPPEEDSVQNAVVVFEGQIVSG